MFWNKVGVPSNFLQLKRPLGRPRRRWDVNIGIDLKEIGVNKNWVDTTLDRDYWRTLLMRH